MAPRRLAVGGLITVAVVLALVAAGCGGGGSSAPAAAGGGSSTAGEASVKVEKEAASAAKSGNGDSSGGKEKPAASSGSSPSGGSADSTKKKHPPLQLPAGKPEEGPTKEQLEAVPTANIDMTIPGGALTAANSCDGKDLSPQLKWHHVPAGTAELALFVMNLQPVEGKLYFDWAVAGIDPSLDGIEAGEVPKGAVVGRNSAGKNDYSLCSQGSGAENYIFALYALPQSVSPKSGFDPLELRKEATDLSQSVGIYSAAY